MRELGTRAGRREAGRFLMEGPDGVAAARAAGICEEVWATESGLRLLDGAPDVLMSDRVCAAVSDTESPQGVLAICRQPRWSVEQVCQRPGPVVWADGLADPGNLGTIIRTVAAVAAAGVVTSHHSVDPFNGKVVRASAGSITSVPVIPDVSVEAVSEALEASGRIIVVLAGDAPRDVFSALRGAEIPATACWVVGSEARGVSSQVRQRAHIQVRIPLPGEVESLNAAVAASIALYAAWDHVGPWV